MHGRPVYTLRIARAMEELRSYAFRERREEYSAEYRIVRSDGEVRWIESRCFISYHSDGRPQRVVGVNIDVTERRRTEQALTDRNRQLAACWQSCAGRKLRNRHRRGAGRFQLATHAVFAGVRSHLWPSRGDRGLLGRRLAFPRPSRRPAAVSAASPTVICRAARRTLRRVSHYASLWDDPLDRGAQFHRV